MVKEFKLLFDSLHHSPGSIIPGKLMVRVNKPKKYSSIVVTFWGGARVCWTESSGYGENRTGWTCTNTETYVHLQAVVWKAENSPTGDLPSGTYHFPFSFHLPRTALASYEGTYGELAYEVEAKILQSGLITNSQKSKHTIIARLIVEDKTPGVNLLRLHSKPVSVEMSRRLTFFCANSGSISATVNLPHTCFSPGEAIPISVDINNQSARQIRISSALHRREVFISSTGRRNMQFSTVTRTLSSRLRTRGIFSFDNTNLRVPTQTHVTMRSCSCIKVEYSLEVTIRIPWNVDMKMTKNVAIANPLHPSSLPRTSVARTLPAAAPFGFQPQQPVGFNAPYRSPYNPYIPQPQLSVGFQAPYSPYGSHIPEQRVGPALPTYDEAVGKF